MSSEYTSTVLLRAREEQIQRDVERIRVQRERAAELLSAQRETARRPRENVIDRVLRSLAAQPRRVAERMGR